MDVRVRTGKGGMARVEYRDAVEANEDDDDTEEV